MIQLWSCFVSGNFCWFQETVSRNNLTKDSRIPLIMCPKQNNKNHIGQVRDRTHQCASKDVDGERPQHHGTNSHWVFPYHFIPLVFIIRFELVVWHHFHQFLIESIIFSGYFFSWNPYLKTDGTSNPILFYAKDLSKIIGSDVRQALVDDEKADNIRIIIFIKIVII